MNQNKGFLPVLYSKVFGNISCMSGSLEISLLSLHLICPLELGTGWREFIQIKGGQRGGQTDLKADTDLQFAIMYFGL